MFKMSNISYFPLSHLFINYFPHAILLTSPVITINKLPTHSNSI